MPKLRQKFLKPAVYCVGRDASGHKQFRDVTAADIADYVAGTQGVIAAGYKSPVLLAHAIPGSDDGAPIQFSEADKTKFGTGWLEEIAVGSDGAAEYVLDIPDQAIADKITRGEIKFTSPELRSEWTDGRGKTHHKIISHVALTHKPRNPDQGQLEPVLAGAGSGAEALQFSLADVVQFADDDPPFKKSEDKSAEAPADNPDLPASQPEDQQQLEALLVILKEVAGLDLPADVTKDTLVRDLLTAAKTAKTAKDQAAAEETKDDENDLGPVTEDNGPMQFSLADVEAPEFKGPKLLSRVIKQEVAAFNGRLDAMVKAGKITPAFRDGLLGKHGALQFSADGDIRTSFTLPEVVDLLDRTTVPGSALAVDQLSTASEEEHPGGYAYTHGKPGDTERPMSDKEAEEISRRVCSR